jgi:hypothetical protein
MRYATRATARAALLVIAASCANGDSTGPSPASSLASAGTVTFSGTAGKSLNVSPTVVIRDRHGNAMSAVPMTVAVTAGGGSLTGAPSESAAGETAIGAWTLGTNAGVNVVTVTTANLPPLSITAIGVAGAPSAMSVASGDNQSALGGTPLSQPIGFKLADEFGNAIANFALNFRVVAGEGSLAGIATTATTSATGIATAPTWTLGKLAVPQQLTASFGNLTASASASVTSRFHTDVRFFGAPLDAKYLGAFTRGVTRLNAEVVGHLAPVTFTNQDLASTCGVIGIPPITEQVASLVIYASVGAIDGVRGVVATSGPCYVRQASNLTVIGTMQFDEADMALLFSRGQLNDVVFHEMQHVLGFGTLWANSIPSLIVHAGTAQTGFTGAGGIHACQQSGGAPLDCLPSIPLEDTGGPGSADSHWRKSIFGNELMTAFLTTTGSAAPLSAMTIGSIADLGYQTNGNVADAYAIPSAIAASYMNLRMALRFASSEVRDVVLKPRFAVTRDGVTSVIP